MDTLYVLIVIIYQSKSPCYKKVKQRDGNTKHTPAETDYCVLLYIIVNTEQELQEQSINANIGPFQTVPGWLLKWPYPKNEDKKDKKLGKQDFSYDCKYTHITFL